MQRSYSPSFPAGRSRRRALVRPERTRAVLLASDDQPCCAIQPYPQAAEAGVRTDSHSRGAVRATSSHLLSMLVHDWIDIIVSSEDGRANPRPSAKYCPSSRVRSQRVSRSRSRGPDGGDASGERDTSEFYGQVMVARRVDVLLFPVTISLQWDRVTGDGIDFVGVRECPHQDLAR
jgi:hypothetical protein